MFTKLPRILVVRGFSSSSFKLNEAIWTEYLYQISVSHHIGKTTLTHQTAPKTFQRYVDDSHARFHLKKNSEKFLNIRNDQDPQIQKNSIKYENNKTELDFLDLSVINSQRIK